jgi:hypothetical protein
MAFNVGEARGNFHLEGLKKSIEDLRNMRNQMVTLQKEYGNQQEKQKKLVRSWQRQSQAVKDATWGASNFKDAIREVNRGLESQISKLREAERAQARYNRLQSFNATKGIGASSGFGGLVGAEQNLAAQSLANFQSGVKSRISSQLQANIQSQIKQITSSAQLGGLNDPFSNLARSAENASKRIITSLRAIPSKGMGAVQFLRGQLNTSIGSYINRTKEAQSATTEWWKRFGLVAVGFSIAYRAINAIEAGIQKLTETFWNGIKVMDEYREGTAEIAVCWR